LNYSKSNGFELQEIEPSEQPNQTETTSLNDLFNDLNDFIRDQKVTKEDLAAAFLAAFYGNSNTQKSLKDYIDLVNQLILTKENQLPTSFAGLISLLNGKKQKLNYEKSWYTTSLSANGKSAFFFVIFFFIFNGIIKANNQK